MSRDDSIELFNNWLRNNLLNFNVERLKNLSNLYQFFKRNNDTWKYLYNVSTLGTYYSKHILIPKHVDLRFIENINLEKLDVMFFTNGKDLSDELKSYLSGGVAVQDDNEKEDPTYQEPNEIIGNKDEDEEKKEEEAVDEIFQKKKRKRSKKIFFDFYTDEDIDKMIEKN